MKKKKPKSDYRLGVLEVLREGTPLTPMELARRLNTSPRQVSRALTDLAKISEALPGRGFLCLEMKAESGAQVPRWSLRGQPEPKKES